LRLLGSVGEPINPEAWIWYQKHIGRGKCPVVDTWWQTETGMILISPLPGVTTTKPGSATRAFPGIEAKILDLEGNEVKVGGGYLAITRPWPAMLRTIWRDDERYVQTYWSKWNKGIYFPGDGAKRDKDGYFWLLGRVDDVMNVAGHRIGTMEVESALVDHHAVAEAAVVGVTDEMKGTAIAAFVILKERGKTASAQADEALHHEVRAHVAKKIGAIARPDKLFFVSDLPKTRSGKIMRRLLRSIAKDEVITQDISTLENPAILEQLKQTL
jgi:acetyl-CoA synthetase